MARKVSGAKELAPTRSNPAFARGFLLRWVMPPVATPAVLPPPKRPAENPSRYLLGKLVALPSELRARPCRVPATLADFRDYGFESIFS